MMYKIDTTKYTKEQAEYLKRAFIENEMDDYAVGGEHDIGGHVRIVASVLYYDPTYKFHNRLSEMIRIHVDQGWVQSREYYLAWIEEMYDLLWANSYYAYSDYTQQELDDMVAKV